MAARTNRDGGTRRTKGASTPLRRVKLVERNDADKQVCFKCKWNGSKKKHTAPNPESKIPHTPVMVNGDKVKLTPARNKNKRKHDRLFGLNKNLNGWLAAKTRSLKNQQNP